jgi:terminase large subunit-like protein
MSVASDLAAALDPSVLMSKCGFRPDPWQGMFLRLRPQRALLLASRQAGKSLVTATCALHEALYRPGSTVLLLSPAQRQSAELLARVRSLLNRLPDRPEVAGEGALSVRLANGSRVLSLPGNEATVRGFSADLLVIDEAARVDNALYEAVRPMLAVTGGRLVALTTPWGRRGWFWEAWSGSEAWHRIRVLAAEVPRISEAFLEEERRALPALVYASEYECEFVDSVTSVFATQDVFAALDDDLVPMFGATK